MSSAQTLGRAGAAFRAIPCVTAHHFSDVFDGLQAAINVPILLIIRETAQTAGAEHPRLRRFGLLATTGTVQSRTFENKFDSCGLTILACKASVQASRVMEAICAVERGEPLNRPRHLIREAATHLPECGAEAIILGCTEIPLGLGTGELSVPIIDPTWNLAQAAVRYALAADSPLAPTRTCYKDR